MDRVDEILFLYEDDRVEMQDGGPITANKIPLKPVNRNINKKGQPDTTRVEMSLGGAAIRAMKAAAKKITDDLDRLPTQNELMKATGKASKTIKNYFKEGIDYLKPMSKKEAAKLGGKKRPDTAVLEVSDDLVKQFKDLKFTHISPSLDTTKAGSKKFRVKFTGPIANDFADIFVDATEENLQKITNQIENITTGNLYKNKAKQFKTPEQFRKLRRLKEAMYKKQDPYNIYENLRKYKAKRFPGSMSEEIVIQHGQPKFTTQTLSRMGLIPSKVNISPAVERAERLRNEVLSRASVKLRNPKRSISEKQSIIDDANAVFTGLKNQLKKTEGSGLVNFELLKLDKAGNVTKLKDKGFNPKKGLAYGEELGELDFSKITREQADEIIKLGKRKIDEELIRRTSNMNMDISPIPGFRRGGYLASGFKKLGKKYKGSTLEAILENPKLVGTELGYEGLAEILRLIGMKDGGIASLPGVKSGPPPESGPNPQGLENVKYYVTNT